MVKKKKQPKFETIEEWEEYHNMKTVDPQIVNRAISREYDNREP